MIPTPPISRLFFFIFYLLLFDFCCAYQSPYSRTSTVFPRQEETRLTSPVTVTTTQTITTDVGTFIQTCTITLTPIVVNGMDMVREDKTCMVTPDNGNSSAVPPPATLTSTSDTPSSTDSVTPPSGTNNIPFSVVAPPSTTDGFSSVSPPMSTGVPSNTTQPDSNATGLPPASSGPVPPPVVSTTLTFVPRPDATSPSPSPPSSTTTPQPDNTDPANVPSSPSPTSPSPQSSGPPSSTVSPTASAENAGAAAPFDPPGKKLEVLPIGLGVFAGVSVIALLVVGIVTYERTKHRRNFRRRRQEEANNRMGYGTV